MTYLPNNLKVLRRLRGRNCSQEVVAGAMDMKRSTYSAYESGASEPTLETLTRLSLFFGVSIDRLLRQDLEALSAHKRSALSNGIDRRIWTDMMDLQPAGHEQA